MLKKILILLIFAGGLLCAQEKADTAKADTSGTQPPKIIQDLKEYAEKEGFFSRLVRSVMSFDENGNYNPEERGYDYRLFQRYEGRYIRNIYVRVLDVFGSSIQHPDREAKNWIQKTGNALHTKSLEWTVRNGLLFDIGDSVNALEFEESERLLRSSSSFYDVILTIAPAGTSGDSVDVWVTTQDIWSILPKANYSPSFGTGSGEIKDINFAGLGSELGGKIIYDKNYTSKWDWGAHAIANNIGAAYVTARLFKESYFDDKEYGAEINRDFITPFIELGGGTNFYWRRDRMLISRSDSVTSEFFNYNLQDVWIGYSVKPLFISNIDERHRLSVAARIAKTDILRNVSVDTLNYNQDNITYFLSAGFSFKRYYKDNYIFGLGRTEDIPAGNIFTFTYGIERGDYYNRVYWGGSAAWAQFDTSYGYVYAAASFGAYKSAGTWQNGALQLETLYFTKLLKVKKIKMRHYIWGRFTETFEPALSPNPLSLSREYGLRGISLDGISGSKRITLSYENNIFYPFEILGFRFASVLFADASYIVKNDEHFNKGKLLEGFGLGLRFRNEHLIFDYIQIMFGFYPKAPNYGASAFNFFAQQRDFYKFNQFHFGRPSVVTVR